MLGLLLVKQPITHSVANDGLCRHASFAITELASADADR
jgi:hypothetical protein